MGLHPLDGGIYNYLDVVVVVVVVVVVAAAAAAHPKKVHSDWVIPFLSCLHGPLEHNLQLAKDVRGSVWLLGKDETTHCDLRIFLL